jgi:hypothetical protein
MYHGEMQSTWCGKDTWSAKSWAIRIARAVANDCFVSVRQCVSVASADYQPHAKISTLKCSRKSAASQGWHFTKFA